MKWIVSYLSTWLGMIMIQLVSAAVIAPVLIPVSFGFVIFGHEGGGVFMWFAMVAYSSVWFWYIFRFFVPVGYKVIIAGLRGVFAIEYVTPGDMRELVSRGVTDLRDDVLWIRGVA